MHALRAHPGGSAFGGDDNPARWDRAVRDGDDLFLRNLAGARTPPTPATGVDLFTGQRVDGTVPLRPLGLAVIGVPRP